GGGGGEGGEEDGGGRAGGGGGVRQAQAGGGRQDRIVQNPRLIVWWRPLVRERGGRPPWRRPSLGFQRPVRGASLASSAHCRIAKPCRRHPARPSLSTADRCRSSGWTA